MHKCCSPPFTRRIVQGMSLTWSLVGWVVVELTDAAQSLDALLISPLMPLAQAVEDFVSVADLLIQRAVQHDLVTAIDGLAGRVLGEEDGE